MHEPTQAPDDGSAGNGGAIPEAVRHGVDRGGEGVCGVADPAQSNGDREAGGGDYPSADREAEAGSPGQGGDEADSPNAEIPRFKIQPDANDEVVYSTGARQRVVKTRDIGLALKLSKGNVLLAAKALGIRKKTVEKRIKCTPELFILYGDPKNPDDRVPETETGTMLRTNADIPGNQIENRELAEQLMKQDRELLRTGLLNAGITPTTIARIRSLDGLARNTGAFLSVSMDLTHRLHIFAQAALFEQLETIRTVHLKDEAMDPMVKVFWQRAFNEVADMLGKGYDRTLAGTQAMMAIMVKSESTKQPGVANAKPGWQQARDVTHVKAPVPTTPPPP